MKSLRVLVIEDEQRLRELLTDVIEDFGFEVASARSAEDGRKLVDQFQPNIIMLDLQLPGVNGMDFFSELRSKNEQIQVIVLTGFGDLDAAQRAIRLDVVDFLDKPFHMADIERSLDRARRKIAPKLPESEATPAPAPSGTLADAEREQILAALKRNNGNRTKTAIELDISRRTLHYRLDEYKRMGYDVG